MHALPECECQECDNGEDGIKLSKRCFHMDQRNPKNSFKKNFPSSHFQVEISIPFVFWMLGWIDTWHVFINHNGFQTIDRFLHESEIFIQTLFPFLNIIIDFILHHKQKHSFHLFFVGINIFKIFMKLNLNNIQDRRGNS